MTNSANVMMDGTRGRLDGQLLLPGDAGYDEARAVWNALVDRRPKMIIRCAGSRDVVTAVRTARELDLEIGVKGGGHSALGLAVPDEGLMIDLSLMSGVRVDPLRRRALVQGGALLGALDAASQQYDLATTAGNVSHTGVGGLTLGGGMGWLARQHGLACDNVVSFEVVTADGEIVRAGQAQRLSRARRDGHRRTRLGRRPRTWPATAPGAARAWPPGERARGRDVLSRASAQVRHRPEACPAPLLHRPLSAAAT